MDTDDLSRETYRAIIETSERFHHDFALPFGVLAYGCKSDDEFLTKSETLVREWLTNWDLDEAIMDIFYDNPPSIKEMKKILDKMLSNIDKVRLIPMNQRKFELW
ncbi:MAG TPA: hypothetical protein DCL77_13820 [Prolixibacteraceae bacterium]|jgi:hypothetical protein|nr:hypothetical protein [Prolixibacteraceae bacterium]